MNRREYDLEIVINDRPIKKVIIDPHYELKHGKSINDKIILQLVKLLDGGTYPVAEKTRDFEYYVTDNLILDKKRYKMIWLLENNQIYIGIVNVYRRK